MTGISCRIKWNLSRQTHCTRI